MAKQGKPPPAELDEFGLPPLIRTETICLILGGITPRRLHQLVTDGRIEKDCLFGGEKWHTMKTLQGVFAYYRRQLDQRKSPSNMDAELLKENLRAARLKNAKVAKELLPRTVYLQVFGELMNVFKNRWLNFADKLAPRVHRAKDKVEVAEILDREIRSIFEGLNDPKAMADLEAKIHDDDFDAGGGPADAAGTSPED